MIGGFVAQALPGQPPQFVINQRDYLVERLLVTLIPFAKQFCHVFGIWSVHRDFSYASNRTVRRVCGDNIGLFRWRDQGRKYFFATPAISASFNAYTYETRQKGWWRGDELYDYEEVGNLSSPIGR
jgi:hypothetical protein